MREHRLYILLVFCLLFAGCEWLEDPNGSNSMEVKLSAKMGVHLTVNDYTKAAVYSNTAEPFGIGLIRFDEGNNSTVEELTATLTAPQGDSHIREIQDFKKVSNSKLVDAPQFFKDQNSKITYTAWYPWPMNDDGTLEMGYVYNTTDNTLKFPITGDSDIMYAEPVEGNMSSGFEVMEFKHALSLFRFYVYSNSSSANSWGNLTSLKLSNTPNECILTLPDLSDSKNYQIRYSGEQREVVVYLNNDGRPILEGFENKGEPVSEWLAAPDNDKVLTIKVNTTKSAQEQTVSIAKDFKPGYAYDIILRFTDNGIINAEVKVDEWPESPTNITEALSTKTYYDLSAVEKANCYIVSSANLSYCFDATVKGNGNTIAFGGGLPAGFTKDLSPSYVKVIWSEVPNHFKLDTNIIVNGRVLFTVTGEDSESKELTSEGNVLLGVYDSMEESANPLWTWHIWITDKPQKQNYTKGYVVLDRNLGAISASSSDLEGSKGLFYQWGRPTPFHLHTSSTGTTINGDNSYTRVTPDEAVRNPLVFYGRFDNTVDGAEDENVENGMDITNNFHDWVDREKFPKVNNLWGYREVEHLKPVKTLYDPCPPGYHVPYSRNWANMSKYSQLKDETPPYTDVVWEALDGGIRLTIEGNDIWYPFQGYINKDGDYDTGHIHMYTTGEGENKVLTYRREDISIVEVWSSLINRHDDLDEGLVDETVNDTPYRFLFTKDYGSMLSDTYSNRSRGLAVRCVSDNTVDVVKDLSAAQTANCYMVHQDGYYKFKATVRGNGVGSLLPLGGTVTAEINGSLSTTISPARVDVLWWQGDFTKSGDFLQSAASNRPKPANMCVTMMDNGQISSDGYASFVIEGFSKGNAVLAAYDAVDNILWTWHIWLTDKPEDKQSGNYTKMDRFLGATFAPIFEGDKTDLSNGKIAWGAGEQQATLGFYYQWGKKDPIIGPPSHSYGSDNSGSSTTSVASSGWWKKETDGTWSYKTSINTKSSASIPEVVKDPTSFYKSVTASGSANSQWFPETFADGYTNVALWGYAVADFSIQGQTFSKTMHDPCPPGYRTPYHHSWYYNDEYRYAGGEWGGSVGAYNLGEYGFDPCGIVTCKTYFDKMWFPFVGYRDPTTGGCKNVGTEGRMNTGMPMRQYETRTFWYDKDGSGQDAGGRSSAYGMMVRCMKE